MAAFISFRAAGLLGGVGLATGESLARRARSLGAGLAVLVAAAVITLGIGSGLHAVTGMPDLYWLRLAVFAGLGSTAGTLVMRDRRPYEGARG